MERFFLLLLRLSLLGSLLTVLLLLLRPLLRGKVSQTTFYYLWLPVLLRLCLPVGSRCFYPLPLPPPRLFRLSPAAPLHCPRKRALWAGASSPSCGDLGRRRAWTGTHGAICAFSGASRKPPSALALSVLRGLDPADRVGLTECPLITTPVLLGAVHPLIVLPVGIEEREQLGMTFDF